MESGCIQECIILVANCIYSVNIELRYGAGHIAHLFYRIIFTIYSEYGGECVLKYDGSN